MDSALKLSSSQELVIAEEVVMEEASVDCVDLTPYFQTNKLFKGRDELVKWARDTGKNIGTIVIILKSDMAGRNPRITLGCEKAGKYKPGAVVEGKGKLRPRQTGTKKCDCTFRLRGTKVKGTEDDWILMVLCGIHNHRVANKLEGRFDEEVANTLVDMMTKIKEKPHDVLIGESTLGNELDINPLLNQLSKKFDDGTDEIKLELVKKLKEIVS